MLGFPSNSISRNTLFNLVGSILPVFVSLVTVSPYLRLIGDARYGVLAIVWVLVGYFSLFNLGLGRAAANQIARLHTALAQETKELFWTALTINTALGLLGGAALFLASRIMFDGVVKIPVELRAEAQATAPWLAAAVSGLIIQSVLTGALEGRERFLTVNILSLSEATLSQIIPLGVAYWHGPDLAWLIGSIVLVKFFFIALALYSCYLHMPIGGIPAINLGLGGSLFRYGGWITVTGIISPLLTMLDQMAIGAYIGAQAVTYYSIPYNLVTRIWILPLSLARTLFPRFSMLNSGEAHQVANRAGIILAVIITPAVVVLQPVLRPFFELWLGPGVASASAPVGEILLLGVWINCLGFIPSVLLQGQGRPDLTAKFHMIELIPYLLALWAGLAVAGVRGAAVAWTLRVIVDTSLLFKATRIPWKHLKSLAPAALLVVLASANTIGGWLAPGWRIALGGGLAAVSLLWAWRTSSQMNLLPRWFPGIKGRMLQGDKV